MPKQKPSTTELLASLKPKHDPQEDDPLKGPIIQEIARDVRQTIREANGLKEGETKIGLCHKIWAEQKRVLKQKGIDWKSPADMNPSMRFD